MEFIEHKIAKQVFDTGVLVDVSDSAVELGLNWKTSVTHTVWNHCVAVPRELVNLQTEDHRLEDLLTAVRKELKKEKYRKMACVEEQKISFSIGIKNFAAGPFRPVHLLAIIGSCRDGKPTVMIALKDEFGTDIPYFSPSETLATN